MSWLIVFLSFVVFAVFLFWVGMYVVCLQLYIDSTDKKERKIKDMILLFVLLPWFLSTFNK